MKKINSIGLIIIVIVLAIGFGIYLYEDGLFGMSEKVVNGENIVSDEVDTSDWEVFEDEELGLSFEYPSVWGDVFVDKTYPIDLPLDSKADMLIRIRFSGESVFTSVFSDNIEQSDVQAGTAHIFNPYIDFTKPLDNIKTDLSKRDLYGGLMVEKIVQDSLNEKKVFMIYEIRGYISVDLYRTVVAPDYFDAKDKRNHLMAGLYLAPVVTIGDNDKEIIYPVDQRYINNSLVESATRVDMFNRFLESIKRY